jgi:N-acetylglucosaminyldiphosphoundecaprenol N-acetyl-beta-D-mannosaminyltransferase
VDGVSATEVVARIVQAAERREGMTATYLNGWTLVQAERELEFSRLLGTFDLCFADGIGVVHSMFLTRLRRISKVTANDFGVLLFQEAANRGLKIAFIGSEEGVAQEVALQMQRRFPGLEIVFCSTGYLSCEQEASVLDHLKQLNPHIVLVGRGQPLQERWIEHCRSILPNTSFLCVGGLFDYLSGRVRQTPSWIRRIGFEWLHRLLHHPHYWYMYVLGIPLLYWHILKFQFIRALQAMEPTHGRTHFGVRATAAAKTTGSVPTRPRAPQT